MRAQRGQAAVEYLIVIAFFAVVLLVVTADHPLTAWDELIQALRTAYRRFSFALSLPT